MYPFKGIVIGTEGAAQSDLRRELADLSVNVRGEFRDVRAALAALTGIPAEPQLFLIQLGSIADVAQVQQLSDIGTGQPIVALVDPTVDPTLLIRAMRAGAAQVVRLPLRSDDFKAAMHRIAVQFGHPPSRTKVISVVGVAEGCGATTVAINLAAEMARLQGVRCILAEGSIALGRLASHLGIEPRLTAYDLLREKEQLDVSQVRNALVQIAENLLVLTGSYRAITPIAVEAPDLQRLINYFQQLADVVVLDLPYTFSSTWFDVLAASQQVVLVAQQNVPCLHALRLMLDKLGTGASSGEQYVVLNRYDATLHDFSAARVAKMLELPHILTISKDGKIVQAAENEGKTLFQEAPQSTALAGISQLVRKLQHLPEPSPRRWSLGAFFNRLGHALRA